MNNKMIVLVPTRGRPQNAIDLLEQHKLHSKVSDIIFIVDDNDPQAGEYFEALGHFYMWKVPNESRGMAKPLNYVASALAKENKYEFFCFLGDDHRPRTDAWDERLIQAGKTPPAIVYGNDLLQGDRLPTMVVMSAEIVTALDGMVPPGMRHLYLDNFWKKLGEDLGSLKYVHDVIVEHMHPLAGKSQWDEGYREVNSQVIYHEDAIAFDAYIKSEQYQNLLEKLRK